ncbi:immunoglobulin domain protein [Dictyocaulus viviparus]|uniref:receptor protein-tyrosine kinase n=1 Tax=Dictyocaulus viviparus TaxID=29172 RepID=A0A0D8X8N4_DICVI|nr:immunoglobulin domain protein [Dictyocaulus viviparus]
MLLDVERKFRIPLGQKQFKLVCPVITNDKDMLMIQWTKNGEQVEWDSRYKLAKDDRELRMKTVQLDDSGRYQCQATNGFDPSEDSLSLKDAIVLANSSNKVEFPLNVPASAPAWLLDMNLDWSSPIQINRGGRMELRCPARGNPLPEIRWYKNNIRIVNESPPHIASFIVDPTSLSDSGEYRCVLENRLGSIEAIFKVFVGDFFDGGKRISATETDANQPPEPIIDQPYNTTVKVGHTAQFLCKAKSTQSPLIKWLKEINNPVEIRQRDPNATVVNASGMHLLVLEQTQVTKEHAGKYICVVTSTQGHIVYKAAHLNVVTAYDFISISFGMDNFWYFVIPIAILFVALVLGAISWLRCNQEPSSQKFLSSKPPPPPRIPPPVAPAEYPQSGPEYNQEYKIDNTRSPIILNNSMFRQKHPMGIVTLDRNNIQRAQRGVEESNLYDNSSPQPYWTQPMMHRPISNSVYTANAGNYRTLEVGHPHTRNYPSMCTDEYSEQKQPFITYRS